MKNKDNYTTKVIFRKYRDGDVIALFVQEAADMSPYHCSSYMAIGQHGAADPMLVIGQTKLAKANEYASLKKELAGLGYDLQVIQKHRYSFIQDRRNSITNYLTK